MAALRDHLEESRAERGQLDHYRSISRELEGAKARVEEELLATAQLVTKLEARLREAHTKVGAGTCELGALVLEMLARIGCFVRSCWMQLAAWVRACGGSRAVSR